MSEKKDRNDAKVKDKSKKDLVRSSSDLDSPSSSNAHNYNALGYQVDPRTGNLQVNITPPSLFGFFGTAITPAIHYSQQDTVSGKQMFGLPLEWTYSYSFIYGSKVFVNGQSSYYIDSAYESGLRYYTLKNLIFKEYGSPQSLPYGSGLTYTSVLRFLNGDLQYFDQNGRLIGMEDRFGNHVLFQYNKEGDIYSSKISKIINAYGQEVVFDYATDGITISYPKGLMNKISFKYLIDKNGYLIGYQDPLGSLSQVINEGGLVRDDLISKIINPNGLEISYNYDALKYYSDPSKQQFSRLDCISSVTLTSNESSRQTTYDYNLNDDAHNFTGYPKYSTAGQTDNLLESSDNDYRYVTCVNDGILITEHSYNRLHLELETKVYTAEGNVLINYIVNTYQGEEEGQVFPLYYELRDQYPNYQTPIQIVTNFYNDMGRRRSQKVESTFDDYGSILEIKTYQSDDTENDFLLVSIETTNYYDYNTCYGQVYQNELADYTKNNLPDSPVITRMSENVLTEDNRNIAVTTNGFTEEENGTPTFKPSKKMTYKYNSVGKAIYQKLEWNDEQEHALQSTETYTTYDISLPILSVVQTNAQEQATTTQMDSVTGWIISQTNALGSVVKYTYDNIGRTLRSTDPMGIVTQWIYDDINNKITTQYATGYETYACYNGFGNQIKSADNMGEGATERVLGTQVYNDKNQLIQSEGILGENSRVIYTYNSKGQGSTVTDALGNVISYMYDVVEQMQTSYFNAIKMNKSSCNRNISTGTIYSAYDSQFEISSVQTSNAYGAVIKSLLGDKNSTVWNEINNFYDAEFNILSFKTTGADDIIGMNTTERDLFTNPVLQTIKTTLSNGESSTALSNTYFYNNLNQLIEERNVLNQSYYYTYNAAGAQVTYTDYAGTVFTSTFDVNNQVTSTWYKDASGKTCTKKFTYYPLTNQLHSIEDFIEGEGQGSISYTYTLDGSLTSMTYPDGKQISFEYDAQKGQLYRFIDALGNITHYLYDTYGRLIGAERVDTEYAVSINYYAKEEDSTNSGQIKSIQTNNGIERRYSYNGFGSVEVLTIVDTTIEVGENILLKMVYSYEQPTGNTIEIRYTSALSPQDQNLNYTVQHAYNSLNQLIATKNLDVSGNVLSSINYSYDAANNVTVEDRTDSTEQLISVAYTYDADNKLLQVTDASGTRNLIYNINGNLIDDGAGSTFTYNEKNILIGYQNKNTNVQASYTYYPDGLRATKKTTEGDLVQFYYDGASTPNIINEVQALESASYLMMGSTRYIRLVETDTSTTPEYFVNNLKDTIAVLSSKNAFESTYEYADYGQEVGSSSPISASPLTITDNPFRYTMEYTDPESGLIYLRSRYYNPDIKRFMTRDSVMLINQYNYADGNPIMNTDPTGHMSRVLSDVLGGVSIALSAVAIAAGGALVATGVGAGVGAMLITSGVLGVSAGATSIAATNTSGKTSKNLNYASLGLGIGSAITGIAAGVGGYSMASEVESATVSTGAVVETNVTNATRIAYGTMIGSGVLGIGADSTGIAAQATNNKKLGEASMGLGIASAAVGAVSLGAGLSDGLNGGYFARPVSETYYRGMRNADVDILMANRRIMPSRETCISPNSDYAGRYAQNIDESLVRIKVRYGTTRELEEIGVRHLSASNRYPTMPGISKGWITRNEAMFKSEGGVMNIGLGTQGALDLFNNRIM